MRRRREDREARQRTFLQQRVQDVRKEITGVCCAYTVFYVRLNTHVLVRFLRIAREEARNRCVPQTDGVLLRPPAAKVY